MSHGSRLETPSDFRLTERLAGPENQGRWSPPTPLHKVVVTLKFTGTTLEVRHVQAPI